MRAQESQHVVEPGGITLHVQGAYQSLVHQARELNDGGVRTSRCLSVDHQHVAQHGDRDFT